MARIRSVKPELRTDLTVASWPRDVRYAWVLLWGYCDDQGRGVDDLRLLTSDLFPLDRDVTERKFAGWFQRFVDSGRVCRYEVDGHRFFHCVNWHHQRINRPTPSRLPPCPTHGGPDERSLNRSRSDSVNGSHNDSRSHSLSDSRSDSPPTRAPAEQGAGSREQGGGAGSKEQGAGAAVAATRDDDPAQHLLDEHLIAVGRPVPPPAVAKLLEQIRQALTDRADPDLVRKALDTYRQRPGSKPGLLPHLIADLVTGDQPDILAAALADPELLRAAGGQP